MADIETRYPPGFTDVTTRAPGVPSMDMGAGQLQAMMGGMANYKASMAERMMRLREEEAQRAAQQQQWQQVMSQRQLVGQADQQRQQMRMASGEQRQQDRMRQLQLQSMLSPVMEYANYGPQGGGATAVMSPHAAGFNALGRGGPGGGGGGGGGGRVGYEGIALSNAEDDARRRRYSEWDDRFRQINQSASDRNK